MRNWAIAGLLLVAACQQQQAKPPAGPTETSFDGAATRNAAATIAHGERLTHILGCTGCHGVKLDGHRFYERYASNLTRELPKYSDAQIERLLRTGMPADGRELWGMPSETFQHLSAADMAALIAYLRTLEPEGPPTQPPLPWTKEAKEFMAKGLLKPATVAVREQKDQLPVDLGPSHALGRYITSVSCAECHGPGLEGHPGDTPNLVVAGGYSRAEFERLITQGVPTGNRKLKELMADVAKNRFSHLTPNERDALYAYLKARSEKP